MPDRTALERQLQELHETRARLEERLRLAEARGRYSSHQADAEDARSEQSATAIELDRVMTHIRAVEAKLALARRGLKPPVG